MVTDALSDLWGNKGDLSLNPTGVESEEFIEKEQHSKILIDDR